MRGGWGRGELRGAGAVVTGLRPGDPSGQTAQHNGGQGGQVIQLKAMGPQTTQLGEEEFTSATTAPGGAAKRGPHRPPFVAKPAVPNYANSLQAYCSQAAHHKNATAQNAPCPKHVKRKPK